LIAGFIVVGAALVTQIKYQPPVRVHALLRVTAEERVFAHRQHQPFCEACCRSSAERQPEMMDDTV
jgi:hypothetical protein